MICHFISRNQVLMFMLIIRLCNAIINVLTISILHFKMVCMLSQPSVKTIIWKLTHKVCENWFSISSITFYLYQNWRKHIEDIHSYQLIDIEIIKNSYIFTFHRCQRVNIGAYRKRIVTRFDNLQKRAIRIILDWYLSAMKLMVFPLNCYL
jgi:hypothetical protein